MQRYPLYVQGYHDFGCCATLIDKSDTLQYTVRVLFTEGRKGESPMTREQIAEVSLVPLVICRTDAAPPRRV